MEDITIRKAELKDIELVARNHALMFEEMFSLENKILEEDKFNMLVESTVSKLTQELPKGICTAWVVENCGKVIASGGLTQVSMTASPMVSNYIYAYLHSIYTDKDCRGRGCAKLILSKAEEFCRETGIQRVLLIASDAGRPIYESIGYKETPFHYKEV